VARALECLGAGLERVTGASSLQSLLADSLGDSRLRLYLAAADGSWHDADGARVPRPVSGDGRFALEIEEAPGSSALVVCDAAVRSQRALLDAVASSVRSVLEHRRLTAMLAETREEVAASRSRIAAAADAERQRIERDIHDGAQQRLIALGIGLGRAEEEIARDPAEAGRLLRDLQAQIGEVVDEVRDLCHGIYPPLLAAAGPADALRSATLRLPVAVTVRDRGLARQPEDLESAVYFCCMEAIQNAIKHGGEIGSVVVEIGQSDRELRFAVSDDGRGFDAGAANGAGITNMRDRLAALGGELTIGFPPGGGTTVSGSIPLAAVSSGNGHGPNWVTPGGGPGGSGAPVTGSGATGAAGAGGGEEAAGLGAGAG
jgi:signal transduction histidine kinase